MAKRLLILITLVAVLCSCEHKDLCYSHPHTAKMRIDVDWSQFNQYEVPTGMTVMVFPQEGGAPITQLSNTTTHVYVNLSEGYYNSIAFNQSVTEFGSLQFRNMNDYETAEVYADTAPTKWYTKASERVAAEPEWFGADKFEMAHVTPEMIEERAQLYGAQHKGNTEYVIGKHTPQNVIYTVKVQVNINGIHNLRSARGAIEGMSEGYNFSKEETLKTTVTHLAEEWSLKTDTSNPMQGYITTALQSFGLPAGHKGTPESNIFTLSLLLADNKTQLDYSFEVGNLWVKSPDEELTLLLNLTIPDALPDVKPEGGSSGGFDATVEDWGEEIEHEILM